MRTKIVVAGFLALLTAFWGWDALIAHTPGGQWPWSLRLQALYLTGVWSIGFMSLAMILATRPAWLETPLGGLDKLYGLHKWIGIIAIGSGAAHWLIKQAGGPLKSLFGSAGKPPKDAVLFFMQPARDLAEGMGEWALYIMLGMLVITLWKWFPYKPWRYLHKIMPVLYLLLVFHVLALMPFIYWQGPTGWITAALLAAGTASSVLSLTQRIGRRRSHQGHIVSVQQTGNVLEVVCDPGPTWRGHQAGQFALLTFDAVEGAHPFTIASAPKTSGPITFQIKALGDYTRKLPYRLAQGQEVKIEGPYGRMNYRNGRKSAEQIWIAGGIGVTPFIAWLEDMQTRPSDRAVSLHYSVRDAANDPLTSRLRELSDKLDNVTLTIHDDAQGTRLDVDELLRSFQQRGKKLDVWFCGPAGFGQSIRARIKSLSLRGTRWHQEVFSFR